MDILKIKNRMNKVLFLHENGKREVMYISSEFRRLFLCNLRILISENIMSTAEPFVDSLIIEMAEVVSENDDYEEIFFDFIDSIDSKLIDVEKRLDYICVYFLLLGHTEMPKRIFEIEDDDLYSIIVGLANTKYFTDIDFDMTNESLIPLVNTDNFNQFISKKNIAEIKEISIFSLEEESFLYFLEHSALDVSYNIGDDFNYDDCIREYHETISSGFYPEENIIVLKKND